MAKAFQSKAPNYKYPGAKVILQLGRWITQKRSQIASVAGEISQELRDRKEKANVHVGAFQLCHKLVAMGEGNPMKLREFLAHFDAYRDDMQLDRLATSQADFVADQKEAERAAKKQAANGNAKKPAAAKKSAKKGPAETTREAAAKGDKFLKDQVANAEDQASASAAEAARIADEANRVGGVH